MVFVSGGVQAGTLEEAVEERAVARKLEGDDTGYGSDTSSSEDEEEAGEEGEEEYSYADLRRIIEMDLNDKDVDELGFALEMDDDDDDDDDDDGDDDDDDDDDGGEEDKDGNVQSQSKAGEGEGGSSAARPAGRRSSVGRWLRSMFSDADDGPAGTDGQKRSKVFRCLAFVLVICTLLCTCAACIVCARRAVRARRARRTPPTRGHEHEVQAVTIVATQSGGSGAAAPHTHAAALKPYQQPSAPPGRSVPAMQHAPPVALAWAEPATPPPEYRPFSPPDASEVTVVALPPTGPAVLATGEQQPAVPRQLEGTPPSQTITMTVTPVPRGGSAQ